MKKYLYSFTEGDGADVRLLGSKGANLCEMTNIGINVPPGFVITTEACREFLDEGTMPDGVMAQVERYVRDLEAATGKTFGHGGRPLLVAVRSGSAMSMPGVLDSVLNLGLNETTVQGLIDQTGDPRFAYDSYRRFIQTFANIAFDIDAAKFERQFREVMNRAGASSDQSLDATHFKEVCDRYAALVHRESGEPFPQDVVVQLRIAIEAIFRSWMGQRAVDYRKDFRITEEMASGTAVNVCAMVFGNMGMDSGAGIGFTRNPDSGKNELYGEFLLNAQGEDVATGARAPQPLQQMQMAQPALFQQLKQLRKKLESHYREVQNFEFTIEKGKLYCLETREAKLSPEAMVKTSVDLYREKVISRDAALMRIDPEILEQLLHPRLDPTHTVNPVAKGLPASPGAAAGKCVFDPEMAMKLARIGEKVILVREDTRPEDIRGFFAAQGILTSRGGKTSHAAVVARGLGKACIVGAENIEVDVNHRMLRIGDKAVREGEIITLDGSSGNVYLGAIATTAAQFSGDLNLLLSWADEVADVQVRANANTPDAARRAGKYGAVGVGLCRTERMFSDPDRLPIVVDMILADNREERKAALDRLMPFQREDFIKLFSVMSPHPVTVRLLDPPMHEFLPSEQQLESEIEHLRLYRSVVHGRHAALTAVGGFPRLPQPCAEINEELVIDALNTKERMLRKVRDLQEVNPMLGHRGVRLGIAYPEIYEMQIQAILEAAAECLRSGVEVKPEILVPQVMAKQELDHVRRSVNRIAFQLEKELGEKIPFHFGTMMETVRACTRAADIAEAVDFFSFGTNDLTQAVFSFSRQDAESKFLPMYRETGIISSNPFEELDVEGVGELIRLAVERGRTVKERLPMGICGEVGGHPSSIRFCHEIGLDYVSCSGPRVPVARLAAAQAKLICGDRPKAPVNEAAPSADKRVA